MLFETEINNEIEFEIETKENLPIELFQELEVELLDSLLHKDNSNGEYSDDETDGPIDFIRQIVDESQKILMKLSKRGKEKHFSTFH